MFKLFKKRTAPVATPEKPKAIDWASMWQSFINAQNAEIREPMTLAQMRLDGQAKDRGAVKGMRMYNEHKAKLQNQWVNPLQSVNSGFGNAQFAYYNYQTVNYFQCYQLAQDPLFTKVFNMLSNTPFSKGGQLTQPEDTDLDEDAIEKAADRYRLWEEIRGAVRSSYVAGGCLIYLDFGQSEEERGRPLHLRKANMHKFVGFKHIDAINITAVNVNTIDPTRPDYMRPEEWYVIGLGVVHRSHFLHFEANPPELPMRPLTLYFGMPLTQLIKQDIANSNLVSQGVANLINRSRLVYLTADDTAFATDNAGQFRARLEWMSMVQDNFGVAPLKQGETVQQLTTALTGFAENVEQCYLLISAKTDIPFTELMGKSASGMNATGEGDRRKWYDKCRTIQESVKREILTMYGIVAGKIGDGKFVEFPDYVFNPLEEATEKELAENIKAYTEVANGLVGLGADPAGVVEWLKSFKQFNLEEIDFDTSAPGLEGYDDDTDPDGTPGGGLPREDITPQVLEAVRAMNDGDKIKAWRSTESGAHFPIKDGQTVKEALDEFVEEKETSKKDHKTVLAPNVKDKSLIQHYGSTKEGQEYINKIIALSAENKTAAEKLNTEYQAKAREYAQKVAESAIENPLDTTKYYMRKDDFDRPKGRSDIFAIAGLDEDGYVLQPVSTADSREKTRSSWVWNKNTELIEMDEAQAREKFSSMSDGSSDTFGGISAKEERLLKRYTHMVPENSHLRKGEHMADADVIKNVIDRTYSPEQTLYRGIQSDYAEELKKLNVGDTFTDKGFGSTSSDEETGASFAGNNGVLLTIKKPAGYGTAISLSWLSEKPEENEWLLQAGSTFKVVAKKGNHIDVEVVPKQGFNQPDGDGSSGDVTPKKTGMYFEDDPELQKQIEKAKSVNITPSKDNILPELGSKEIAQIKKYGQDPTGKKVVFKSSTIARNAKKHGEVPIEEYNEIIGTGLYLPEMVAPGHGGKPYFNMIARVGDNKNSLVLLDVDCSKENCEIVHCYWNRDKSRRNVIDKANKIIQKKNQ